MNNWRDLLVKPTTSILDTMKNIDQTASQIALVVDSENKLLGTVTDGDIRRGLLNGVSTKESIQSIMNRNPITVTPERTINEIKSMVNNKKLRQIPVVVETNRVIDIIFSDELSKKEQIDNLVVLMAGGLGTRLYPLTKDTPKPMLTVGTKPILQTILESFIEHGFSNFLLSVNYKRDLITDYFKNGSQWDIAVDYLTENKRLGTAGALSLLDERPTKPFIVMNGDILTKINFKKLLESHVNSNSLATMCIRDYQYKIPYGVVRTENEKLYSIEEKPTESYSVNAGIYVLSPEVLDYIPKDTFYDMPSLFKELINLNKNTTVFPIEEYWLDIGKMNDFEKANLEYSEVFE